MEQWKHGNAGDASEQANAAHGGMRSQKADPLFWIWLSLALNPGGSDFRRLVRLYDGPYEVYEAEAAELERVPGLTPSGLAALLRKDLAEAVRIKDLCERMGIGILPFDSPEYPPLLREINSPPVLLYYVGKLPKWEKQLNLGVVGTRKMSVYGMETAYKIAYELTAAGAVTVSGMAAGIDGVCAAASLRAGGRTVAVLGCGLDRAYPAHHGKLMKRIAEQGLLFSEYPPGTPPVSYHFPTRNRIISGLSHGTVVVEAGLGSGSLITAAEAISQGRDVFAVPANADGIGAEGANGLLRDGAFFAAEPADIAARYAYLFPQELQADLGRRLQKLHAEPDIAYLTELGVLKKDHKFAKRPEQRPAELYEEEPLAAVPPRAVRTSAAKTARRATVQPAPAKPAPSAQEPARTDPMPLQTLSPIELAVLQAMPDSGAVTLDTLGNIGYPYGELLTALTMLEINGLVQSLPGSAYRKA